MARVLAFTPVWRLEPETVEAMRRQDYGGDWHWLMGYANPHPERRDPRGLKNVLHQYEEGRRIFLAGDWDWLWIVESDVIPPPDALTRLARLIEDGADAAYGVYLFRQPWPNKVTNVTAYNPGAPDRGCVYTIDKRHKLPTGVIRCSGSGLGCVLVTRALLETVPFRHGDWQGHCDTHWNIDVYHGGYKQMADMDVICGHKTPEGEVIWP